MPIIFLYSILIFKHFIHSKDILKNLNNQNLNNSFFEITDNFQRPIDPKLILQEDLMIGKKSYQKLTNQLFMDMEHKVIDF